MPTTFPIDSLQTLEQKVNYLGHKLDSVSLNTDSFGNNFSSFVTILSIVASVVTIIGLLALFLDISKRNISKKTQKKIIIDLLRHFMVNNAILESIWRHRKNKKPQIPIEGTLCRFAALEDDTDIGRFSVKAKYYEKLHNICLSLRNYNSVVCMADKHLHDSNYPQKTLDKELESIFERSIYLTKRLLELSQDVHCFKITEASFAKYVESRYLQKEDGKVSDSQPGSEPKYKHFIKNKKCDYYNKINLDEAYNYLINHHWEKIIYE